MAKSKAELLAEAKDLGLEVTAKNTVAEITAAIAAISQTPVEAAEAGETEVAKEGQAEEKKTAKAGKRSEKGIKEAEKKTEKVEAQKHREEEKSEAEADKKPKQPQRATSKLERQSKGIRKSAELIEKGKVYNLKEALDLAVKTSHVKFDATVELHVNLGVDPRQADQNLRDTIQLPAGTGKAVRVAVLADADDAATAKNAGADIAGSEDFLAQLDKNVIDFDILIATPAMMAKLGKYARVLGPKGLMPNPKSGTVTTDVAKAVAEAKAGRVEYRVDTTGIIHVGVGKVSFGADKLGQNVRAIFASIKQNKPSSLKSSYVQAIHLATTMGPSIKVELSEI
jgi:large subunit ribosomal protein L1